MFQLWKLVLLCGLLTGTSASFLDHLLKDLNTAVNNLESALDKGLETVDNRLEPITQELKAELGVLQETKSSQEVNQKIENVETLLNDVFATVFQIVETITGDISILDIEPELTSDGNGVILRIPATFNISLTLPLLGKIADLSASFDLLTTVTVETDAETGVSTVVMGECTVDLSNFSLTLLDSRLPLVSRIVDTLTKDLRKIVSLVVQKELNFKRRTSSHKAKLKLVYEETRCDVRLLVRAGL
ncbi:BPI fold-containing family A member 2 [Camelus dromedarius]|uniref:BPI fold-containing family A member 2 n=1 Tax=Camelus dromedarius TaxID=9838 RepID=A0A5N4CUI6_CAMDR|nr:BPI fold-containing family A member 2 [Camelus dromedarius]